MLSLHFTVSEWTRSQAASRLGLDNDPPPEALAAGRLLATRVLEPIRALVRSMHVGAVVVINSGYRSPTVNAAVGGATSSQHVLGEAADIEVPGVSNGELARLVGGSTIPFDQLILEFHMPRSPSSGWVHVSYRPGPRGQVLTIAREGGRVVTRPGLVT